MKISNYMNHYPISLKKNRDNTEKKNVNNNSSNPTNPFGAFYNFQAINSLAFMGKVTQYPPFFVIDSNYNIVKDKHGKPMEFTCAPEVRNRLGLTAYEQHNISGIFNENCDKKTFSCLGTKYICVLKDEVTKDGEIDEELVKSKADKIFIHGKTIFLPPFFVVDKDSNIVKDEQGKPMEFTSVPEVRDRLGLTKTGQNGISSIFNENSNVKIFPHGGTKYTCVLKDDVTKDGETDEELIKTKAQEMFKIGKSNRKITFYAPFYVVDRDYNIVSDKYGNPIEFTSVPEIREKLELTKSEQSGIVRIFSEKYRDKTFSHDGTKYTCISKHKVSNPDGSINNYMLKREAVKMFNRIKIPKG